MSTALHALIIEDDPPTAEDVRLVLDSLLIASEAVDNQQAALARFAAARFDLVLLDLEIKPRPESLRSSPDAGRELLRRLRAGSPRGSAIVIVVSGHAADPDDAVEVMRDGADDVVQKPLSKNPGSLATKVRRALAARPQTSPAAIVIPTRRVLSISGTPKARRFIVEIDGRPVDLTPASLERLLQLVAGKLRGETVDRSALKARNDHGFHGISRLRDELGRLPGAADLVKTLGNGRYALDDIVEIGPVSDEALKRIESGSITRLVDEIATLRGKRGPEAADGSASRGTRHASGVARKPGG